MNNIIFNMDFIETDNLPYEMLVKILYENNGLQHPTSKIINNYINNYFDTKKCFVCKKKNISLAECTLSYICNKKIHFIKKVILESHNPKNIWLCFSCAH